MGYDEILNDFGSGDQSVIRDRRAVRTAPEVVVLEIVVPQTSISEGREEKPVFFIRS